MAKPRFMHWVLWITVALYFVIGAVICFAGDGGMPAQNTPPPTDTITTEWIIALCAVVGTILTGIGLWLNHKRKQK